MKVKSWAAVAAALVLCAFVAIGVAGDEKPWFDMKNCSMCKDVNPALMQHMAWDHYDMSNGVISITTVEPASMADYKTMCTSMEATSKRLAAGEKLPLCGMCTEYMSLMAKGAKTEMVWTKDGSVRMVTATDPAVVAGLHKWAATTRAEMQKMAAAGAGQTAAH